jgi:hypothetical protein
MDEREKAKPTRILLSASIFAVALGSGVHAAAALPSEQRQDEVSSTFGAKWQLIESALTNGALGITQEAVPARSRNIFAQFRNIAWANS